MKDFWMRYLRAFLMGIQVTIGMMMAQIIPTLDSSYDMVITMFTSAVFFASAYMIHDSDILKPKTNQ